MVFKHLVHSLTASTFVLACIISSFPSSTEAQSTTAASTCPNQFSINSARKDFKGSKKNPAFAPFDCVVTGNGFTTSPCTRDNQCQTGCCDGKKCRAPDALKREERCRNGLKPKFDRNGKLSFVRVKASKA